MTTWRYAYASVTGPSHRLQATPCQDAGECHVLYGADGFPVLVAIASDGAGSAIRSDEGSRQACAFFIEAISALIASGGTAECITREVVEKWLSGFQHQIADIAASENLPPREFACTLLGAVIGRNAAAFFQVGDGAIVVSTAEDADNFTWAFWPQHGEYANQTNFASQPNAGDHLEYAVSVGRSAQITEIALFTDGIERLVLDFPNQLVHHPFFRTLIAALRSQPTGYSPTYSDKIGEFLDRPSVASRSDDDKTLILATLREHVT